MPLSKKVTVEQLQWIASRAERTDRMPRREKLLALAAALAASLGTGTNGGKRLKG